MMLSSECLTGDPLHHYGYASEKGFYLAVFRFFLPDSAYDARTPQLRDY